MQAVILAAGKGLRLRPFTEHHPKPLIPIADKPLIEYSLQALPTAITEIIIVIGYLGDQIQNHLGDVWNGIPIHYITQTELDGTGDALQRAKTLLHDTFLVINGDDLYLQSDLIRLIQKPMSILAWQSTKPSEYGLAVTTEQTLSTFDSQAHLINCGAYYLDNRFFSIPLAPIQVRERTEYSLPHTLIQLAPKIAITVVLAKSWLPVGTPQQLAFANSYYIKRLGM